MAKWLYLAAAVVVFSAGYAFADALRTADIERLRGAAAGGGRVPAGTCDSGKLCERRIKECQRLLSEGADILEESGRLVGRFNADRNSVRQALK